MMKRKIILTIFIITLLFTTCNIVYNVSASYHLRQLCVDTNGDTSTVCDSKYDMNETNVKNRMVYQHLGNTGLMVSRLSYGAWITFGNQIDVDQAYEIMKFCIERGVNFFDNAEAYANGVAETMMGNALQKIFQTMPDVTREDLVITTKIFFGVKRPLYYPNRVGLSRKHIIEGLKQSLKRMQLDFVDVVFAHRFDHHTPMEEIVRSFNHVIDQGLAHYWCTSEWSASNIEEAYGVAKRLNLIPPACEQPQYNLLHRERFEIEYKDLYIKYGLGTTIWSALASGVLTGKYNNGIPENSRLGLSSLSSFKQQFLSGKRHGPWEDIIKRVLLLQAMADSIGCTLPQLSIAWTLKNPHVSTVIMGGTKIHQLNDNLGSLLCAEKLTAELMDKIERIMETKPDVPRDWTMYTRL